MPEDDDEGLGNQRWMRQMKAMQDLVNPPWLRQMRAVQDAVNPPWLRQMRALQDAVNPRWLRQMQALQDVVDPPWLRQMRAFQEAIAPRLRATMTLGASAALLTRTMLPGIGRDSISAALSSVTSSILGHSVESIARAFPSRSTLAAEALSVLAGLKLQGPASEQLSTDDTPLVSSLASLQGAIDTSQSQEEFVQRLTDAIEEIAQKFRALRGTPGGKALDVSTVLSFLSLIVSVVALHLADVQVRYAELSEQRAQRQELDARSTQRNSDEHAAKLQAALDKLIRLQGDALASAVRTDDSVTDHVRRFAVSRAVVVRERQDNRSKRLAILHAGEIVEVDECHRHWAHVRLVDHVRGGTRAGWVRKKYLTLHE